MQKIKRKQEDESTVTQNITKKQTRLHNNYNKMHAPHSRNPKNYIFKANLVLFSFKVSQRVQKPSSGKYDVMWM